MLSVAFSKVYPYPVSKYYDDMTSSLLDNENEYVRYTCIIKIQQYPISWLNPINTTPFMLPQLV